MYSMLEECVILIYALEVISTEAFFFFFYHPMMSSAYDRAGLVFIGRPHLSGCAT